MAEAEVERNEFLDATGEFQDLLGEIYQNDGATSVDSLAEKESELGLLLLSGFYAMNRKVISPKEYYQGCMAMLLAKLFRQDGVRPQAVIASLQSCLKMKERAGEPPLLLNLALDRTTHHAGLDLDDWVHVLGLVETIRENVAVVNRRIERRKKWLHSNKQQQRLLSHKGQGKIAQDNLDAMWVVTLSYIVGFVVQDLTCKKSGGDQVLSWKDDIQPRIDNILGAAFPRLRPPPFIDAGLVLLKLDLLNEGLGSMVEDLNTESVSKALQDVNVLKPVENATDLPRYTLLARCAQIFMNRLGTDNHNHIVDACTQLLRQESPMQYLDRLEKEKSLSNGDNTMLLTDQNTTTYDGPQSLLRDSINSNAYPLLHHMDAFLLDDNASEAINIAVEMEKNSALTRKEQEEAWQIVLDFLVMTGHIFLDGFPLHRQEYMENRKLVLEKVMASQSGPVAVPTFVETYLSILERVTNNPNVDDAEHEFIQRACHQTVLRILQAKFGEYEGIDAFQDIYLHNVESIIVGENSRISLSVLSTGSPQERRKWARDLLTEPNEVPDSLRLDNTLRPNIIELLNRAEPEKEHRLITDAKTPAATKEAIRAVVLDESSPGAMDVDMEDVGETEPEVQETLRADAPREATKTDAEKENAEALVVIDDDDDDEEAAQEKEDVEEAAVEAEEELAAVEVEENDAAVEQQAASEDEGGDSDVIVLDDSSDEEVDASNTLRRDEEDTGPAYDSEEDVDMYDGHQEEKLDPAHYNESEEEDYDGSQEEKVDPAHYNESEEDDYDGHAEAKVDPPYYNESEEDDYDGRAEAKVDPAHYQDSEEDEDDGHAEAKVDRSEPNDVVDILSDDDEEEEQENAHPEANEGGSHGEMVETNASQSVDEAEAGSQTGYEPEDTQGFTEEEVSEAMHTEDEEEERQEARKVTLAKVNESKEEVPEPVKPPVAARMEAHTLSDMDAADEHTTEHEEDLGAESSELDEGDGDAPPYADTPGKANKGSTLMDFAARAQRQVDPERSTTPTHDTTTASIPWQWPQTSSSSPKLDLDPQESRVGENSAHDASEPETAVVDAAEAPTPKQADPEVASTGDDGKMSAAARLETPASAYRQHSVADTSAAQFGSVSFVDSPNYAPTDDEVDESTPKQKILVDCVPEVFEHSPAKSRKKVLTDEAAAEDAEALAVVDDKDNVGDAAEEKPEENAMKPAAVSAPNKSEGAGVEEGESPAKEPEAKLSLEEEVSTTNKKKLQSPDTPGNEKEKEEEAEISESAEPEKTEDQGHPNQDEASGNEAGEASVEVVDVDMEDDDDEDGVDAQMEEADDTPAAVNDPEGSNSQEPSKEEPQGTKSQDIVEDEDIDDDDDKHENEEPEGAKQLETSKDDFAEGEDDGDEKEIEEPEGAKPQESAKDNTDEDATETTDHEGSKAQVTATTEEKGEDGDDVEMEEQEGTMEDKNDDESAAKEPEAAEAEPEGSEASVEELAQKSVDPDGDEALEVAADDPEGQIVPDPEGATEEAEALEADEAEDANDSPTKSKTDTSDDEVAEGEAPEDDANIKSETEEEEESAAAPPAPSTPVQQVKRTLRSGGNVHDSGGTLGGKSINIPANYNAMSPAMSSVAASDYGGSMRSPPNLPTEPQTNNDAEEETKAEKEPPKTARKSNRRRAKAAQEAEVQSSPEKPASQKRSPSKEEDSESPTKKARLSEDGSTGDGDEAEAAEAEDQQEKPDTKDNEVDVNDDASAGSGSSAEGPSEEKAPPKTVHKEADPVSDMEHEDGEESDADAMEVEDIKETSKRPARAGRKTRGSSPAASTSSRPTRRSARATRGRKKEESEAEDEQEDLSLAGSRRSTRQRKTKATRGSKTEESEAEDEQEDQSLAGSQRKTKATRGRKTEESEAEDEQEDQSLAESQGKTKATRGRKTEESDAEDEQEDQSVAGSRRSTRQRKTKTAASVAGTPRSTRRGTRAKKGDESSEAKNDRGDESTVASQGTRRSTRAKKMSPKAAAAAASYSEAVLEEQKGTKRSGEEINDSEAENDSDDADETASTRSKSKTGRKKPKKMAETIDNLAPIPEEETLASPVLKAPVKRATRAKRGKAATTDDEESDADSKKTAPRSTRTTRAKRGKAASAATDDEESVASEKEETKPKTTRATRARRGRAASSDDESIASSQAPRRATRGRKKTEQSSDDDESVVEKEETKSKAKPTPAKRNTRGGAKRTAPAKATKEDDGDDSSTEEEEEEAKPEAKPKAPARRGRAPKAKPAPTTDEESAAEEEKPKRRGKPPKAKAAAKKTTRGAKRGKAAKESSDDEPKADEVSVADSTTSSVRRSGRSTRARKTYKE